MWIQGESAGPKSSFRRRSGWDLTPCARSTPVPLDRPGGIDRTVQVTSDVSIVSVEGERPRHKALMSGRFQTGAKLEAPSVSMKCRARG